MRILIVSPTLNYGGAERVAAMWANGFIQKGHQVFFVTNIEDNCAYHLSSFVHILPLTKAKGGKFVKYINSVFLLRSYYKRYNPDVIIGIMYACSLLGKIAEIGLGIPVINTEHNSFERPPSQPMSWVDRIAKFYINYLYDAVTVLTEADKRYLNGRFKRVYVLPNPVFLMPLESISQKEKIVLAAGRLDAWIVKGFDVLIKAFGLLTKNEELRIKDLGWRLQIAGTGSDESLAYLKQLCKENGVEDTVDFLGVRTDIEELYKQSEIFVLSSRYEGFGLVLIEAMSQGCACVACDFHGRQHEIITDNSMGLCCGPDDVGSLSNQLRHMIVNDDYRETVQKESVKRSRYYCIDNVLERWDDIFSHLLHN